MARSPYIDEKSRIVLSFCNADGGHIFVHWLRNELMKELNYFSSKSIYLDNVETRNFSRGEAEYHNGSNASLNAAIEKGQNRRVPVIGPDLRKDAKFVGYIPNGAMFIDQNGTNKDQALWLKNWETAINEANVVIQIQTNGYFASAPCALEICRINNLLKDNSKHVKLIAITLDGTTPKIFSANLGSKCKILPLSEHPNNSLPGTYNLSANDFARLKNELVDWAGC